MKYAKNFIIMATVFCMSILGGCGDDENNANGINSANTSKNETKVDIDLSSMTDIMGYAQLTEIMADPDAYLGKTIRMTGSFYPLGSDVTPDLFYYYILLTDNTSCCTQGLEFIWDDNAHSFPDDYPTADTIIEVEGPLSFYVENDEKFCYLDVDTIKIVK